MIYSDHDLLRLW